MTKQIIGCLWAFLFFVVLTCSVFAVADDELLQTATYQINYITWSQDAALFGVNVDNDFIIYDALTERIERSFPMRRNLIYAAGFSEFENQRFVTLLSADGTLELWSYTRDVLLDTVHIGDKIYKNGFAVSNSADYIAVTLSNNAIRLYMRLRYTDRLSPRDLFGHKKNVYALDFSPDGKYMVSASRDNTFRIWHTESCTTVAVIQFKPLHDIPVLFTPDGKYVIGTTEAKRLTVWDLTGREMWTLPVKQNIAGFDISGDGSVVRILTENGRFEYYDFKNGAYLGHIRTRQNDEIVVKSFSFSPDDNDVLISYNDGTLYRMLVSKSFKAEKKLKPRVIYPGDVPPAESMSGEVSAEKKVRRVIPFVSELSFLCGSNIFFNNELSFSANIDIFYSARIPYTPVYVGIGTEGIFAFPRDFQLISTASNIGFTLFLPIGLTFEPVQGLAIGSELRLGSRFMTPLSAITGNDSSQLMSPSFAGQLLAFVKWRGFSVYAGCEYDTDYGINAVVSLGYGIRFESKKEIWK